MISTPFQLFNVWSVFWEHFYINNKCVATFFLPIWFPIWPLKLIFYKENLNSCLNCRQIDLICYEFHVVLCMFILINFTNLKHFWTTLLGVIWPIFEQKFIHIIIIYMKQQLFVKMMNVFICCQIYYCTYILYMYNRNWALNSFNCFNLLSKIFMQNRIIKLTDYLQFIIQNTHICWYCLILWEFKNINMSIIIIRAISIPYHNSIFIILFHKFNVVVE